MDTPLGRRSAGVNLLAGSLAACLARRGQSLRLRACGGAAVGAARAQGSAFSPPSASGVWAAATVGLDARWAFTKRLGLTGNVELYVPFVVPKIEVVGTQLEASRSFPAFGVALGGGPSVLFW